MARITGANQRTIYYLQLVALVLLSNGLSTVRAQNLFWVERSLGDDRIATTDLNGVFVDSLVTWPDLMDPTGMVLDPSDGRIYWAENTPGAEAIRRAMLDGSTPETILSTPAVQNPSALAIDSANGNLYFADGLPGAERIARTDLSGSNVVTLLNWPVVADVASLAVDPAGGKVYWAQATPGADRIGRADVTGANPEDLLTWPAVTNLAAIALDTSAGKVYWAERLFGEDRIGRANLDGTAAETFLSWPEIADPVGIALEPLTQMLYWAEKRLGDDRLSRVPIGAGMVQASSNIEVLKEWPGVADPVGLALYVPGTCPPPAVSAAGSRYLAITPAPGAGPVALFVRGIGADVGCVGRYVGPNGTLEDAPTFLSPSTWQTVYVRHADIVPERFYSVQADCGDGALSVEVPTITWAWGDTNDSGFVDVDDILMVLAGFAGNFSVVAFEAVNMLPCEAPDPSVETIDVDDILAVLAGFAGTPYQQSGCAHPCP